MAGKKTFREKLADDKDFPRVQPLAGGMKKRFGEGTIVIPAGREVDELNEKYPGGLEGQAQRLAAEGHSLVQRGKKLVVEDYERSLVRLD